MHLVEEPIWQSYLFFRMCVVFVNLGVSVSLHSRDKALKISVASNGTPAWNAKVHISYLYILFDHC